MTSGFAIFGLGKRESGKMESERGGRGPSPSFRSFVRRGKIEIKIDKSFTSIDHAHELKQVVRVAVVVVYQQHAHGPMGRK